MVFLIMGANQQRTNFGARAPGPRGYVHGYCQPLRDISFKSGASLTTYRMDGIYRKAEFGRRQRPR